MQLINDRLNYFSVDEVSKCKLFKLTLVGSARLWFNGMSDVSIKSQTDFCEQFSIHFTAYKRKHVRVATLNGIVQGKKERLRSYIDHFTQVVVEVEGAEESLKCWIFKNGLLCNHPFRLKIERKKLRTTQGMLSMSQSYMILEEKLDTRFDNPISTPTPTSRQGMSYTGGEDDYEQGMQVRYEK